MSNFLGDPCSGSGGGGTASDPIYGEWSTPLPRQQVAYSTLNEPFGFYDLVPGDTKGITLIGGGVVENGFQIDSSGEYKFSFDFNMELLESGQERVFNGWSYINGIQTGNATQYSIISDQTLPMTFSGIVDLDAGQLLQIRFQLISGADCNIIFQRSNWAITKLGGVKGEDGKDGLKGDTGAAGGIQWKNEWDSSVVYDEFDTVQEEGWLMIANKTTQEYPTPQPIGEPTYLYGGVGSDNIQNTKQLLTGMRYTFTQGGYFLGYRIYTTVGNHYDVNLIKDPLGAPEVVPLISFTASVGGWQELNLAGIVVSGSTYDLIAVVTEPNVAPTETKANYDYKTGAGTPLSGQIVHPNSDRDILRINKTDDNLNNIGAFLLSLVAGDLIGTPELTWSIQGSTDEGGYVEFIVSPATQLSTVGVQEFTFSQTSLTNISYYEDFDFWFGEANVRGLISTDGTVGGIVDNTNQYLLDVKLQEAKVPVDWDFMAYTGSVGGGSVSMQDTYNNSTAPQIQLTDEVGAIIIRNNSTTAIMEIQREDGTRSIALKKERLVVEGTTLGRIEIQNSGSVAADVNGQIAFGIEPFASPVAGDIKCNNTKLKFGILNVDRVELDSKEFYPTTTNNINLGNVGKRWKNGYFASEIFCADGISDDQAATVGQLNRKNGYHLQVLKEVSQTINNATSSQIVNYAVAQQNTGEGICWNWFSNTGDFVVLRGGVYNVSYSMPWLGNANASARVCQFRILQNTGTPVPVQNWARNEIFAEANGEICCCGSVSIRLESGWRCYIECYSTQGTDICGASEYQFGGLTIMAMDLDAPVIP